MIETQPLPGAATPAPAAIERLLRRALLLLGRSESNAQDRLDLAELADAVGAPGIATVARDAARLRLGFAPDPAVAEDTPPTAIERAMIELRGLMDVEPGPVVAAVPAATNPISLLATLCRLLDAPFDAAAEAELAAVLESLRADGVPADPRGQVDGSLAELVASTAAHELQLFARRNHALAYPPYGSARLLHHAARLRPGGLGPYFSTVGNIVRDGQDILGLIALAAGDQASATVARWVVPLAARIPQALLAALFDDLADLGLAEPLDGLLDAASRPTDPPASAPLLRLRDAALDLGELALAMRAQERILASRPLDAVEWRRAGDLRASAGDTAGAEAAYAYALRLAPRDAETLAHRTALLAGDASAIEGGFETPPARRRARLARRAA